MLFYCDKSKSLVRRLLVAMNQITDRLLTEAVKFNSLLNRFSETAQFTVEVVSENIVRLFNLRGIEWTEDIENFLEHIEIIQQWETFVCEEVPKFLKKGGTRSDRTGNEWTEALKLNTLRPCRSQLASRFFGSLHKQSISSEMKEAF